MTAKAFETYLSKLKIARTVLSVQQHHTYIPSYIHFNGNNHFELKKSMKNTHINANGWEDIGQHISIFQDGSVMTGRSFEKSPACIYGNNANSFCIENVGNFDKRSDQMTAQQKNVIITITAALLKKFGLSPNTNTKLKQKKLLSITRLLIWRPLLGLGTESLKPGSIVLMPLALFQSTQAMIICLKSTKPEVLRQTNLSKMLKSIYH
ncbi:MAG: hypothetical protein BGO86_03590 [Chryseobacterium sp. 36-9]|nr:MAG: hypothetical protein BGO86_03590 [Chryseobacterium sp. 36-9]